MPVQSNEEKDWQLFPSIWRPYFIVIILTQWCQSLKPKSNLSGWAMCKWDWDPPHLNRWRGVLHLQYAWYFGIFFFPLSYLFLPDLCSSLQCCNLFISEGTPPHPLPPSFPPSLSLFFFALSFSSGVTWQDIHVDMSLCDPKAQEGSCL